VRRFHLNKRKLKKVIKELIQSGSVGVEFATEYPLKYEGKLLYVNTTSQGHDVVLNLTTEAYCSLPKSFHKYYGRKIGTLQ
jgi:hypothetical protein